jgi:hypothetical protein
LEQQVIPEMRVTPVLPEGAAEVEQGELLIQRGPLTINTQLRDRVEDPRAPQERRETQVIPEQLEHPLLLAVIIL